MTEQQRKETIKYIDGQLENGYIDLGSHDQNELDIIKEAMCLLKTLDEFNSLGCTSFVLTKEDAQKLKQNGNIRVYDHIWDMYLDEFEDEEV